MMHTFSSSMSCACDSRRNRREVGGVCTVARGSKTSSRWHSVFRTHVHVLVGGGEGDSGAHASVWARGWHGEVAARCPSRGTDLQNAQYVITCGHITEGHRFPSEQRS